MKVLLSIDESMHSQVAVKVVCARAWPAATEFRVLMVLEGADGEAAAAAARERLAPVAKELELQVAGCTAEARTVFGDPQKAILDDAGKWGADLIAMGSRGRTGITRMLLGSVSQAVLGGASTAVLIARVPGNSSDADALRQTMKRVVLAIDATEHSQAAVRWLTGLPAVEGTEIQVVSVLAPLSTRYENGLSALQSRDIAWGSDADRRDADTFVKKIAGDIKRALPMAEVTTSLVTGEPAAGIINAARDFRAGLILMGTRGHAGMTRVMLGSVSMDVVSGAGCPVEIVKSRPKRSD